MLVLLMAAALAATDTVVVVGRAHRDLTGDGVDERLEVVGTGSTLDSLELVFTINSADRVLFRTPLLPLTRMTGFDAGARRTSAAEHTRRLREFGPWFFDDRKFETPGVFIDGHSVHGRQLLTAIPAAIERDRPPSDTRDGATIWREIREGSVTLFTFSPGGDIVYSIGWSNVAQRFYRLVECC